MFSLWFGYPHHEFLLGDHRLLAFSAVIHDAGCLLDNCPPLPDIPCLFKCDWPDMPSHVLAYLEIDG